MRIAICEDTPADREELIEYIHGYCAAGAYDCGIREYKSGEELLLACADGALFDAAFLDVYLPGRSGIETARALRGYCPDCAVILVTMSAQHALEGYEVSAVSYVVKPLSEEKMARAFSAVRRIFEENARTLKIQTDRGVVSAPFHAIRYIEVFDKRTVFHLKRGQLSARVTLDEIGRQLGGKPFLRCHRSYIINLNFVADTDSQDFIMEGGDRVPIRRKDRRELKLCAARYFATHQR